METLRILMWPALFFFCLWSALLARFKGYSAACWLLGGGALGVVILFCLPLASPYESAKQRRGNRLGLALSVAFLLAGWLVKQFL